MDYSPPDFSVHGISQARILEWVAISISRGSSQLRIEPTSPALARVFFTTEPLRKPLSLTLQFFVKDIISFQLSSVQLFSHVQLFVTPWITACQASLSITNSQSWVNSLHEVAKVLEFQPQHQSFQWTPRTGLLQDGLVGSPCSPGDSQESSPAPQLEPSKTNFYS